MTSCTLPDPDIFTLHTRSPKTIFPPDSSPSSTLLACCGYALQIWKSARFIVMLVWHDIELCIAWPASARLVCHAKITLFFLVLQNLNYTQHIRAAQIKPATCLSVHFYNSRVRSIHWHTSQVSRPSHIVACDSGSTSSNLAFLGFVLPCSRSSSRTKYGLQICLGLEECNLWCCLWKVGEICIAWRARGVQFVLRGVGVSHAEYASEGPLKNCDARPCITGIMGYAKYAWQTWQSSRPRHFYIWYQVVRLRFAPLVQDDHELHLFSDQRGEILVHGRVRNVEVFAMHCKYVWLWKLVMQIYELWAHCNMQPSMTSFSAAVCFVLRMANCVFAWHARGIPAHASQISFRSFHLVSTTRAARWTAPLGLGKAGWA